MALLQLVLLMLASQVALNDAAAVNQLPPHTPLTPEKNKILEVITNARGKGPAFHAPPFFLDMYKEMSNTETADAVPRMIGFPGKKLGKSFRFDIQDDFRHDLSQHQVALFVLPPACETITVSVYDVKSGGKIQSSPLACSGSGWMSVKLDDSAQITRGIRVQIEEVDLEQEPWIVYTARSTEPSSRTRRSSLPDSKNVKQPGDCAKVDKIFNPAKHSWTGWLYPKVMNLYQCRGSCPVTRVQALGTNHAQMMVALGSGEKEACCVPIKWSSAYVLHKHEDTIVAVNFSDIVVEECGCSY